jgi:hypothetical protein
MDTEPAEAPGPSFFRLVLGFLAVGIAWGFTTPFIRKAAITHKAPVRPEISDTSTLVKRRILYTWYSIYDLISRPAYSVPLLLNLSGSVWFFLLVGQAELSLTVPVTNSLAFLFTVLGERWAEGKLITGGQQALISMLHLNNR